MRIARSIQQEKIPYLSCLSQIGLVMILLLPTFDVFGLASYESTRRWPYGCVPYTLVGRMKDPYERSIAEAGINAWKKSGLKIWNKNEEPVPLGCESFKESTNSAAEVLPVLHEAFIVVRFTGGACESDSRGYPMGASSNPAHPLERWVNLSQVGCGFAYSSEREDMFNMMHEFGHGLGNAHEYQRADGAGKILFRKEYYQSQGGSAPSQFERKPSISRYFGEFDHASIMGYPWWQAGPINGNPRSTWGFNGDDADYLSWFGDSEFTDDDVDMSQYIFVAPRDENNQLPELPVGLGASSNKLVNLVNYLYSRKVNYRDNNGNVMEAEDYSISTGDIQATRDYYDLDYQQTADMTAYSISQTSYCSSREYGNNQCTNKNEVVFVAKAQNLGPWDSHGSTLTIDLPSVVDLDVYDYRPIDDSGVECSRPPGTNRQIVCSAGLLRPYEKAVVRIGVRFKDGKDHNGQTFKLTVEGAEQDEDDYLDNAVKTKGMGGSMAYWIVLMLAALGLFRNVKQLKLKTSNRIAQANISKNFKRMRLVPVVLLLSVSQHLWAIEFDSSNYNVEYRDYDEDGLLDIVFIQSANAGEFQSSFVLLKRSYENYKVFVTPSIIETGESADARHTISYLDKSGDGLLDLILQPLDSTDKGVVIIGSYDNEANVWDLEGTWTAFTEDGKGFTMNLSNQDNKADDISQHHCLDITNYHDVTIENGGIVLAEEPGEFLYEYVNNNLLLDSQGLAWKKINNSSYPSMGRVNILSLTNQYWFELFYPGSTYIVGQSFTQTCTLVDTQNHVISAEIFDYPDGAMISMTLDFDDLRPNTTYQNSPNAENSVSITGYHSDYPNGSGVASNSYITINEYDDEHISGTMTLRKAYRFGYFTIYPRMEVSFDLKLPKPQ